MRKHAHWLYPRNVHGVEVVNANRSEQENAMARIYAQNYNLIEFADSDNHSASRQKKLAGVCFTEPICSVADFIAKVKANKLGLFTLVNE